MTAAAESTRVPTAGGGAVRAVTALVEPGPAGEPGRTAVGRHEVSRSPNIADRYAVVLQALDPRQRRGVIAALSVGFCEGWRPTREELAAYVAAEFGRRFIHPSVRPAVTGHPARPEPQQPKAKPHASSGWGGRARRGWGSPG